jgi:hypothetical protein
VTTENNPPAAPSGVEIVYERDQWRFKSAWSTGRLLNPEGPTYVRSDIHEAALARVRSETLEEAARKCDDVGYKFAAAGIRALDPKGAAGR